LFNGCKIRSEESTIAARSDVIAEILRRLLCVEFKVVEDPTIHTVKGAIQQIIDRGYTTNCVTRALHLDSKYGPTDPPASKRIWDPVLKAEQRIDIAVVVINKVSPFTIFCVGALCLADFRVLQREEGSNAAMAAAGHMLYVQTPLCLPKEENKNNENKNNPADNNNNSILLSPNSKRSRRQPDYYK
jgi:hypothetical protein